MADARQVEKIQKIAVEVKTCTLCALHHSRVKAVPGYGQSTAQILFLGNTPDFFEDKEGLPLVGKAGLIFDKLLQKANTHRKQVYMTYMVKCRPPNDRQPEPLELEKCASYLTRQIEAIQPKVVVTLGRTAMQQIMPNANLNEVHGQIVEINGQQYMPFYHPASVINKPSLQTILEADFEKLIDWIDDPIAETDGLQTKLLKEEDKQEQLSLF